MPAPAENILPAVPIPPPPDRLRSRGREIWGALWEAGGSAYWPATDRFIVERYCLLQDRHADLWEILDGVGFVSVGSQGQEVAHPAARLLDTVEKELRATEDRLGLNPDARARLGISAAEAKSKLDAFLEDD